jgi:hypothetical protein
MSRRLFQRGGGHAKKKKKKIHVKKIKNFVVTISRKKQSGKMIAAGLRAEPGLKDTSGLATKQKKFEGRPREETFFYDVRERPRGPI